MLCFHFFFSFRYYFYLDWSARLAARERRHRFRPADRYGDVRMWPGRPIIHLSVPWFSLIFLCGCTLPCVCVCVCRCIIRWIRFQLISHWILDTHGIDISRGKGSINLDVHEIFFGSYHGLMLTIEKFILNHPNVRACSVMREMTEFIDRRHHRIF